MKKFVVRFVLVALVLMTAFAFCACDGNSSDKSNNDVDVPNDSASGNDGQNNSNTEKFSPYRGVIITQVYGNGDNADGAVERSYVQLYNCTDKEISLAGASLYYRGNNDMKYSELAFSAEDKIAAKGYFLIAFAKGNPIDKDTGATITHGPYIFKIEKFDKECADPLDNKIVDLAVAQSNKLYDGDVPAFELEGTVTCFRASETSEGSKFAVMGMSKKKIAVRASLSEDSGFKVLKLNELTTVELNEIKPYTSEGDVNTFVNSAVE